MADKGKIIIGNKDISEIPIHERTKLGLGYLSQQRSVFNMSVYDNLLGICQLTIKNTEEQRRVTEKLLDEFNLQHLRTLNSNVLSGGEKVRCLISKMMLEEGNLLILDEPTSHLDLESITKFNNSLIEFPSNVLFTSHDHQFVQTVANRIIEITPNGIIDKLMTYDEYLQDPKVKELRESMYTVNSNA